MISITSQSHIRRYRWGVIRNRTYDSILNTQIWLHTTSTAKICILQNWNILQEDCMSVLFFANHCSTELSVLPSRKETCANFTLFLWFFLVNPKTMICFSKGLTITQMKEPGMEIGELPFTPVNFWKFIAFWLFLKISYSQTCSTFLL